MVNNEIYNGINNGITDWWFGTCFFPYIGNVIIPTDELIFFRGVGIPPTRWEFQDPKMEVLYHVFGHILWGYSL